MGVVIDHRPLHGKRLTLKERKQKPFTCMMVSPACKSFLSICVMSSEQTHSKFLRENPSSVSFLWQICTLRTYFHPHWVFFFWVCGWNGWRKQASKLGPKCFLLVGFLAFAQGRLNLSLRLEIHGEIHLLMKYLYNPEGSFLASLEPHPSSLFSIYFSLSSTFCNRRKVQDTFCAKRSSTHYSSSYLVFF